MKLFPVLTLSVALTGLASCDTPREHLAEGFGNAVRQNMAAHIINPEGLRADEIPAHDGARAMRAHDRLVTEKQTAPTLQIPAFVIQQSGNK